MGVSRTVTRVVGSAACQGLWRTRAGSKPASFGSHIATKLLGQAGEAACAFYGSGAL